LLLTTPKALEAKKASEHRLRQREAGSGLEKRLANLWSRRKITKKPSKKAHAVRGREIKWEIPDKLAVNYYEHKKDFKKLPAKRDHCRLVRA
jgi:hypothetical protein